MAADDRFAAFGPVRRFPQGTRTAQDAAAAIGCEVGQICKSLVFRVGDGPGAPLLVVSQFTLYGDTRKGRRPSWTAAARPEVASVQFQRVVTELRQRGARVSTGTFGAMMSVHSVNDGPFTVLVEV